MKISEASKKIILGMSILLALIILAGIIYYRSLAVSPFVLGAFLGTALNALKVIMLERTVEKAVEMDDKIAGKYLYLQYLLRFALTAVVLVLAAICPFISLWGAAAGVLTLQIAAFSTKLFPERDKKTGENSNENSGENA